MEYTRSSNLHPSWMFPWWGRSNKADSPKGKIYSPYSKREKLRSAIHMRLRFAHSFFRRSAGGVHKKEATKFSPAAKPAKTANSSEAQQMASSETGGYKIVSGFPDEGYLPARPRTRSSANAPREGSNVTQGEKLSVQSVADTSENHSILRKIRLRWLQNTEYERFTQPPKEKRRSVPQSISFLKEMCPGPSTTEVSCPVR